MSCVQGMLAVNCKTNMPGMILSNQLTIANSAAGFTKSQHSDAKREKEAIINNSKNLVRYASSKVSSSKQSEAVTCLTDSISSWNPNARIDSWPTLRKNLTAREQIRTLILDNYDSYTYNLYQLLSVINGVAPVVLRNDEVTWEELCKLLYDKRAFHNVVISPGPGSPTCASDIGVCLRLLKECPDIPILGVCLGHQALGAVHGAKILHAPEPVHGRLSEIQHSGHPLFSGVPSGSGSGFKVVRYHSLMVDGSTLPGDLIPTAWTTATSNCESVSDGLKASSVATLTESQVAWHGRGSGGYSGGCSERSANGPTNADSYSKASRDQGGTQVLMGISHRHWPHHGVQFHPESVATAYGKQILENFRDITIQYWDEQAQRYAKLAKVSHNPYKGVDAGMLAASVEGYHEALQRGPAFLSDVSSTTYDLRFQSRDFLHSVFQGSNKIRSEQNMSSSKERERDGEEILRLHWKKLPGLAATVGGSNNIFCKIYGTENTEDTFWLDSSTRDQGRARFSFMGGKGGSLWHRFTYRIGYGGIDDMLPGVLTVENAAGQIKEAVLQEGFLNLLNKELQLRSCPEEDYGTLPFDFCGGFIGYLGYELKVECGAGSNRHRSSMPDAGMFLADQVVVVDHSTDDIYVLALYEDSIEEICESSVVGRTNSSSSQKVVAICGVGDKQNSYSKLTSLLKKTKEVQSNRSTLEVEEQNEFGSGKRGAERWVEKIISKINRLSQQFLHEGSERMHRLNLVSTVKTRDGGINPSFVADKSRGAYMKDVRKCQELIKDGETYEVCLTTQLRKKFTSVDRFGLYLTLRETNPAPYSAWMQFGKEGPCICSSSPERFLRLDRRGVLEAKPIKGTVARGNTPEEDEILKHTLQHSEKDQAENLMIVDLLRNDLGRVCEPGSVHVPSLMAVESYSTVHTMVSTVRGKKRADVSPVDCIKAAFPGGSMTGAPKLRTMEIIDSLESSPRGIYSGTIGYFSFNSSFDLNIVIRTLVIHDGEASLGAGGAVIALSDPAAEFEEMVLKAKAPSKAISKFENAHISSEQIGSILPLG